MRSKEVKKNRDMYALCDAAMIDAYMSLENTNAMLKRSTERYDELVRLNASQVILDNEANLKKGLENSISALEQAANSYSTLKEYYKKEIEKTGYTPRQPGIPEENEIYGLIKAGEYNLPEAVKNVYQGKEKASMYSPILSIYRRRGYSKITASDKVIPLAG